MTDPRRARWWLLAMIALAAAALALPPGPWPHTGAWEQRAWAQPPAGDPEHEPALAAPGSFPVLVPAPVTEPAGAARPAVSPVIFPEQRIPLRFSHALHLALPGAPACTACHAAATRSMSSLDNLIPTEQACRACHAIDRSQPEKAVAAGAPPARCDACHVGYRPEARVVDRVSIPTPNIKFPHRAHLERGMACTGCHGDLAAEGVALATRAQLPKMATCLGCHDGRRAASTCTTCHLADAGGLVRTLYPSGKLLPSGGLRGDAHDLGFRTAHAAAARNDPGYCASCHQKPFCVDCHDGEIKPMDFHGGNYVALHALDARRNVPDCTACHRLQTFCTGCHARAGVSADGRGSELVSGEPERRFHPPGWADMTGGGPGHHGFEARRNIVSCVSCHREQFCVTCHTAEPGSMGVSPHPPGWAASRRCRALLARNPRVCLRCHLTPDELRCAP
jgi:c(7)-type cytochrome triheme protein